MVSGSRGLLLYSNARDIATHPAQSNAYENVARRRVGRKSDIDLCKIVEIRNLAKIIAITPEYNLLSVWRPRWTKVVSLNRSAAITAKLHIYCQPDGITTICIHYPDLVTTHCCSVTGERDLLAIRRPSGLLITDATKGTGQRYLSCAVDVHTNNIDTVGAVA